MIFKYAEKQSYRTQVTAELRNTVRESENCSSEYKITSLYNYKLIAMYSSSSIHLH